MKKNEAAREGRAKDEKKEGTVIAVVMPPKWTERQHETSVPDQEYY
jgi:hypothetical protein